MNNNSSCTNIMAVWVLSRALELLKTLPSDRCAELWEALTLSDAEIERWRDVTRKMRVVFLDGGIISQFEGYDQPEEFDWDRYRRNTATSPAWTGSWKPRAKRRTATGPPSRRRSDAVLIFSAEELARLFEQFGYPFERDTIPRNIDYYLQRTSHGSTLSGVVHFWVLARSDRARSWQLFTRALEADISDVQGGTTAEGIHLSATAGTVDLVQRGHTGIVTLAKMCSGSIHACRTNGRCCASGSDTGRSPWRLKSTDPGWLCAASRDRKSHSGGLQGTDAKTRGRTDGGGQSGRLRLRGELILHGGARHAVLRKRPCESAQRCAAPRLTADRCGRADRLRPRQPFRVRLDSPLREKLGRGLRMTKTA